MPDICEAYMSQAEVETTISLPQVLSGLSAALDLAAANPLGHSLRTCIIGMKLAKRIGLNPKQFEDLFYALLLKDLGTTGETSESLQFRQEAGLEANLLWKAGFRGMPRRRALSAVRSLQQADPSWRGLRNLVYSSFAMKAQRWQRASDNKLHVKSRLQDLNLNPGIAEIIEYVGARWDGKGHPRTTPRRGIPLLSQIVKISQMLDILRTIYGGKKAIEIVHKRCKGWFDPGLIAAATLTFHSENKWAEISSTHSIENVTCHFPEMDEKKLDDKDLDRICQAFANIVDSHAHNTAGHSVGVALLCERMAEQLNLPEERTRTLRRAAWLHDLGLLSVKISVLDKAAPLNDIEQKMVQKAPLITYSILAGIPGFHDVATIAAAHHERLDGTGYPFNLTASSLSLPARILAVADVAEALAAARSYRPRLNNQEIYEVMNSLTPHALDATCVLALREPLLAFVA